MRWIGGRSAATVKFFFVWTLTIVGVSVVAQGGSGVQTVPQPIRPNRLPAINISAMQASPVLAGLDDESALFQKLNVQPITSRGSLAQGFSSRTITLEDGRSETLANVAREFLLEQNAIAQQARGVAGGVLARPVDVKDDVLEFDDAYAVVHSTSVTVADPAAFSRSSPEFRTYLGRVQIPATLTRANLHAESLPGFEAYLRNELPQLPAGDPLRRAYQAGGESALLRAIAEGQGTLEVMDTLFVPKAFDTARGGAMQRPMIENGVVRYNRLQPLTGLLRSPSESLRDTPDRTETDIADAPPKRVEMPSVTTRGTDRFDAKFMAGFTRSHSWEWERRWSFPSGSFRITLRGHYGIGLRIPIAVSGSLSPTAVTVKDSRDQVVPVRANVSVRTLDADPDFYSQVGLRNDRFAGKEAVCEAAFGWGLKFRALWSDIVFVRVHDVANLSLSQNFKPPFGADPDAYYRVEIPASLTGTSFDWSAVSGFAQAGLRFDGKGSVTMDAQPFIGDRELAVQHLRFSNTGAKAIDFLLPALPVNSRQRTQAEPFGLTLRQPAYSVDLSVVPQVRAEVTVGYDWVSHTFSTGWKSLNAFRVGLGTVSLSHHAGTTDSFRYANGRKQVEYLESAPSAAPRQYRATLQAMPSNKYVRAGVGPQQTLTATSDRPAAWELFEIIEIGQGLVALKSVENSKFVRIGVREGNDDHLGALSNRADVLETFRMIDLGRNRVALQAIRTNKYVRAGLGKTSFLSAVSDQIGAWETFVLQRVGGS